MPDLNDSITPYSIRVGGIRPEAGQSYRYTDDQHDFWFYIHCKAPPEVDELTILVHHASPRFTAADRAVIERNVRDYFERFDTLERPTSPSNPPIPVKFTWKIGE